MSGRRPPRWPLALAGAVASAEVAVAVLRPRGRPTAPVSVSARSYFSPAEIERARRFRRPQLALAGMQVALRAGLLGTLARRPPRRLDRRPLVGGALVGAGLAAGSTLAGLPLGAVARRRAIEVGLVTQPWDAWVADVGKATAIELPLAGAGGALAVAAMRRAPRRWWVPGAAGTLALGVLSLYAGPLLLDPLFNRFTPLPEGPTRSAVLDLASRAEVGVGQVYAVDASRRTTAANAYVTGLGRTRRVVLFDTLLEHFSAAEIRLVVAHELAHVRHRDVARGLLYLTLVAPAGALAVQRLAERLTPQRETPSALPAVALALGIVGLAVSTISTRLSRAVERRADAFALALTQEPEPFIAFERRIAVRNLAEPSPPAWVQALLATHPSTLERIGAAVAFAQRPQ